MEKENIMGMGAVLDPYDWRDMPAGGLTGTPSSVHDQPDSKITDISRYKVLNQGSYLKCVGFTRALYLMYLMYKDINETDMVSGNFIYDLAKLSDGIPNIGGTYPRTVSIDGIKTGALLEVDYQVSEDHKLTLEELTPDVKLKAALQKISGYATVKPTELELVQAIIDFGIVEATLPCDGVWNTQPIKMGAPTGFHRITIFGYERKEDDTYFYFRNSWGESWGKRGNGIFKWKDFSNRIYDMYTLVDFPNAKFDILKELPRTIDYTWNTNMSFGSNGEDVKQLQFVLKYEGFMDLLEAHDGKYGNMTMEAVKRYQKSHSLGTDGVCGPQTLKSLNGTYSHAQVGLLSRWALCIQSREGYFAPGENARYPLGTPSWRRRNPGNIRYIGMYAQMAIGQEKGFCVFSSYEKGFEALRTLLKNAASGRSTVYHPTMSILEFFQKYAPKSDGNDPVSYALEVAKKLGVSVETPISKLNS